MKVIKKYKVKTECFCEGYLHEVSSYYREGLKEKKLNEGDEVELDKEWSNFYGTYLRVKKGDIYYDILPENLKLIETKIVK